jgi:hypothetical protein
MAASPRKFLDSVTVKASNFQKVRLRQSLGLKGWQASTELGLLQRGSLYLMSTERSANFSIYSGDVKYHHKIVVENLQIKIMT